MPGTHFLDNPIWHSLLTDHSNLALGDDLARRYPADIGPLSGMADQSRAAYEALRALAGANGTLALFLEEPARDQSGWTLVRTGAMSQMIFNGSAAPSPGPLSPAATLRPLTFEDVNEMVELAELTEPGPFRRRTATLGNFFGIFEGGRLLAMAGQRSRPSGFIEVSAVCTHPDARGRGYAYAAMASVVDDILRQSAVPFLHVLAENYSAIRVYERLGFVQRRPLHLGVYKNGR
ncbi:MAG: GNAT family N-acetyltransferase [Terracidiphilus sp.]